MAVYHVDEAGDSVLWAKRGELLIGSTGCSRFFIMGLAKIAGVKQLEADLADLRQELLNDPYFQGVPSMQPEARKTAYCFHAKADMSEVRREVFRLLRKHSIEFHAVVRNKIEVAQIVSDFRKLHPDYRYDQNQLYDDLVRKLMQDKLHSEPAYTVVFARRGNSDRTYALKKALRVARAKWCEHHGIAESSVPPVFVQGLYCRDSGALQAVDYFLWALQRLYEKGEDRYVKLMWSQFHCVWDCDDKRSGPEGVYYTQEKPLDAACL